MDGYWCSARMYLTLQEELNRATLMDATNLVNWVALKTNVVSGGYFDYLDTSSTGLPRCYYRARWVP